ncbi:MAG TPA: sulfur carrier protein ThiS adenylyltransferase ThiF [Clostridiales bacterium]|nr:sulfur carrier protein ThiS adenylyltransferase ThiF [Clostridiales bacterium]
MTITVNKQRIDTMATDVFTLKHSIYGNNDNVITIVDGFQTNENLTLLDIGEIIFIDKTKMPSENEMEYMLSARHTPQVYDKVKKARVAIAGLGGLGSNVALALARTGVGTLHLIDFDVVEPSNLNRQQYFISHLGKNKTDAMKNIISQVNPYVNVVTDNVKITQDNVSTVFEQDKIICEAFDNKESKAMLVTELLSDNTDKVLISASGMAGYESSNTIVTRKITDNFYLCGDGVTGAKIGRGLMAPRVQICAGHEANAILRIILGETEL